MHREDGHLDIENKAAALKEIVGNDEVWENVPMKEYTSFKAGGNAGILVMPDNDDQLRQVLKLVLSWQSPFYIMGEGSNTLIRDEGYRGIIIKIGPAMSAIKIDGEKIRAQSGALIKDVSQAALDNGLTGLEFAVGIPGSVGGTSYMNAGAYDGEMRKVVESVKVLSNDGRRTYELTEEELEYGYRSSRIMTEGGIVLATTFALEKGDPDLIKTKMDEFQEKRKAKQPLDYPSAGSFFKRPPGNFAGTLIEKTGLKGSQVGGAMVSPLHAGFIINTGGATAEDIINLKNLVQEKVLEKYGIKLEQEVRIIGGE